MTQHSPHAFSLPLAGPKEEPIDQAGIRHNLYLDPSLADGRGLFDPEVIVRTLGPAEAPELYALLRDSSDPDDDVETMRLPEVVRAGSQALDDSDDDPTTPWRMDERTVITRRRTRARARPGSRRAKLGYFAGAVAVLSTALLLAGLPPTLGAGPAQYEPVEVACEVGWVESRLSAALEAELDPAVGIGALELGLRFARAPSVPILAGGPAAYSVAVW
jgi:hypothetical protein